ncbi:hypothetical protein R0131_08755 [Clostridium sp. AL.422]|uniref:hypothetical protein n=1 Tax=Clostridium TaxID=1485 RepID=UPI00293DC7BE|nr:MULTISPECIES: hypothetical protein [unclassified Clostridium]MDV4150924.1 hypothetical protein [Clostridium sp. AL.422]
MEMNEILNGLNSCGCSDDVSSNCSNQSIGSFNNNGCFGFGSWIWILLILFYSGGFGGGYGGNRAYRCCKKERKRDHCCEEYDPCCDGGYGSRFGGGLGSCTPYLFLLVILFLCNGSGFGNCGNFGSGNLFGGCC